MFRETSPVHIFHPEDSDNDNLEKLAEAGADSRRESIEFTPEKIDKDVIQSVERLLHEQTRKIGAGLTAEVHYPADKENVCFKIITKQTAYGKNIPEPEVPVTYKRDQDKKRPPCNSLELEGEYLGMVCNLDPEVKVPRPHAYLTAQSEHEGEGYLVTEDMSILLMERLNAVSLRKVLEDGADLPATFNPDTFFSKLRNFLKKMHAKQIHHRDLHEGNIMVDLVSGNPCVIDFGDAGKGIGEDAYTIAWSQKGRSGTFRYLVTDDDNLVKVEAKIRAELTKRGL